MKQILLLHLVILLVSLSSITATTYYVLADGGDDCPTGNECHPLSYYTSHSDSYFTNNTVFYLLKGNHYMNEGVVIQGKSNITINGTGMSSSVIRCTNEHNGGFAFFECNSIVFSALSIMECKSLCNLSTNINVTGYGTIQPYSTISIISTWEIYLHLVSIEYNGIDDTTALIIANGMELYISDSFFCSGNNGIAVGMFYTPVTHKNIISESVNVSLINCTVTGGMFGLQLSILHGMSYRVVVVLNNLNVSYNYINIGFVLSSSLYSIDMNKVQSHDAITGLYIALADDNMHGFDAGNLTNARLLPHPLVIRNSEFYNNLIYGLYFGFKQLSNTNEQTIILKSCKIYNNNDFGFYLSTGFPSELISLLLENTVIFRNSKNLIKNFNKVTFNNVSIYGTTSTGLTLTGSGAHLYIDGTVKVFNNTGADGGGIALSKGSRIVLYMGSQLLVYNNKADNRGGGIFADLAFSCPFLIDCGSGNAGNNPIVNISGNTALLGDDIYGFNAQSCTKNILFNSNIQQTSFAVTVCFCNGPLYSDCIITYPQLSSIPGQSVALNIALFGYDYNRNYTITDGNIEIIQGVTKSVHSIKASCFSVSQRIEADGELNIVVSPNITSLSANLIALPCPKGFALSSNGICDCSPNIEGSNVICDIETLQISRSGLLWIGTYSISNSNNHTNDTECLIREQCLLCNQSDVTFTLDDNEYLQCNHNRSGMLCGQCRDNYSLLLGSNECSMCDNSNLALIVLFAALGIILVMFLLLLNLTVAQGTLNGIIFYVNIVKLYQPVFSREGAYPFLNQFLSWFNLDFGVETCFFNGMNEYSKTWLQYAFPLYLWAILFVIIITSEKSRRVSKILSKLNDPLPVLSTIFLLSYTKILRTSISGLHMRHVTLHCENENSSMASLWYVDPNLPYAQGKHLWLFLFSLAMLLFFCIPYTLFLLFNPLLERYCQNYKCCHFLFRLKPIFDAYNGPVKDKYRFWTGLLLVARLPPLLAVAFIDSFVDESRLILQSILLANITLVLLISFWLQGVYESNFLNRLELWFLLKLIIMIALAISFCGDNVSKIWFSCCIAVFCASFIVVLVYHLHLKLINIQRYKLVLKKISFGRKLKLITNTNIRDYGAATKSNMHEVTHYAFQIKRHGSHDSIIELFDPPNDEDYYIENNHSY